MNKLEPVILRGKYGEAHIYANHIPDGVLSQCHQMLNQEFTKDLKIRIMPDVHVGKGCMIGTTMQVKDEVCVNLVGVDIGCLDCDTEILTESGWIKISKYKDNEKILQFDPATNTGMFIKPQLYIKKKCDWFYHFKNSKGLDQMISEEHNILMYYGHKNRKINYKTIRPEFLISLDDKKLSKNYYMFNTTFNIKNKGIEISDEMIRIDIMTQADGRIKEYENYNFVELHFKKERKILRAENLLKKANITYNKYSSKDTTFISFRVPKYINKNLKKYWKANYEQLKIVAEESLLWDGHLGYRSFYSSSNKDSIDVIQFAFIATDVRASLYNVKNTKYWMVIPTKNKYVGYNKKPKIVQSKDGYKYCFKTDTGFFLCRRNGYTFLTGNCGMLTVNMGQIDVDFKKLDDVITKFVPLGFAKHNVISKTSENFFKNNPIIAQIALETPMRSIGTLGGGNHFIEVCMDSETGDKYLVIHTGSRNLGKQIAEYWHKVGVEKSQTQIKDLATIKGEDLENYLKDTFVAQRYASLNRETIARVILDKTFSLNLDNLDHFETIHNYIDPVDKILRKGAISAKKDETVLIPLNMRDGSLICKGKGNPDWNESAPHGAGRILSRGQAKECVDLEEFVDSMKGIYSSSVSKSTLDESPMVYKDSEDIKKCIVDTVKIIKHIKPIYNRKA